MPILCPLLLVSIARYSTFDNHKKRENPSLWDFSYQVARYSTIVVPVVGFEPTLLERNGILSPARLPIPPHRHIEIHKKLPFEEAYRMERKIGLTPISRSGKERVLKIELLPHILKYRWSGR